MKAILTSIVVPAIVSLVVALVVSYFGPRFNFPVWRRQKRKEQQLAIAERFAKISASPYSVGYDNYDSNHETWLRAQELRQERQTLLFLIPVIFEDAKTWELVTRVTILIDALDGWTKITPEGYLLLIQVGARLFAEALDIPMTGKHSVRLQSE
jgi:hypothetical protein